MHRFRLPSIAKKEHPLAASLGSIKRYMFTEFSFIEKDLARGSFGNVSLVKANSELLIYKECSIDDEYLKKLVLKEISILSGLSHQNIVMFKGVCLPETSTAAAIVMEYVRFDFSFLSTDTELIHPPVSTLHQFLATIRELGIDYFAHCLPSIIRSTIEGLDYLHQNNIAHRDLKTSNVLVSNAHYTCGQKLSADEIANIWSTKPIQGKITDFGESRSYVLRTITAQQTVRKTQNVFRGSIPYMAPEITKGEKKELSQEELKKCDIWSLGIIFHQLFNLASIQPYAKELVKAAASGMPSDSIIKQLIGGCHRRELLPANNREMDAIRRTHENVFLFIRTVHLFCCTFEGRPNSTEVLACMKNIDRYEKIVLKFLLVNPLYLTIVE